MDYATADKTAEAGSDYQETSGTLYFPAGTTTKTVSVPVYGDAQSESNEDFLLKLSGPSNATIPDAEGTATISNDDTANDDPVARNDSYAIKGKTLTVPAASGVLKNDTDPDGDVLTAARVVNGPSTGKLTLNADGLFTYKGKVKKPVTFVYEASDGKGGTDQATVTISKAKKK